MSFKILLIEDDPVILRFLNLAIKTEGYETSTANNGVFGVNMFINSSPDLILLDLGLPDIDGMDVIKEIRKSANTPIIVISARETEQDKVQALDSGANDFITKPFNIGEVLARVRVWLREKPNSENESTFELLDLFVDFEKRIITVAGKEVHFTPIEYKLLELLIQHKGKVLTHNFIQNKIWGYSTVDDYQSLRVFMASIRRKIETEDKSCQYILTEVGVGYRFRDS
ncbi:MAG: response regulator transcription factor [Candidatus Izemoplasmatales bacterium]|jgi:two-component system KDP operon response regulator KdpE|nr:response regulator transcription factor [Candidatus Izemoplasmatales bacterium]